VTENLPEEIPPGIEWEARFAFYLRELGWRFTISTDLDLTHAIDILVTGHESHRLGRGRIAVQLTSCRRSNGKAKDFAKRAGRRVKGPLLYAKFQGRPGPKMAKALDRGLLELCRADGPKAARRAHGFMIYSDASTRWFGIMQPSQA
jgi:hypothetical protein